MLLPLIGHGESELHSLPVGIGDIACHADLHFLAVLVRQGGDQCHFTVVVDLCKADQHRLRQLAQRVHEAVIFAFVRHVFDELLFHPRVFRADRPDGDNAAIRLLPILDELRRIGVNGHV